jgi:hypothetical protein
LAHLEFLFRIRHTCGLMDTYGTTDTSPSCPVIFEEVLSLHTS